MKRFLILTALVAALLMPFQAEAVTFNADATPIMASDIGTTFHVDWTSLTAARVDTGTTTISVREYSTAFGKSSGINSSGVPVITITIASTFAASIDSTRDELHWGPTASGPWIATHTFSGSTGGANTTLTTATVPTKTITFTPPAPGFLRWRKVNCDATTTGLIDTYFTLVARRQ